MRKSSPDHAVPSLSDTHTHITQTLTVEIPPRQHTVDSRTNIGMINNVCTVTVEDCSTSECTNKRQLLRQKHLEDEDEEGEEELETASTSLSILPTDRIRNDGGFY